MTAAPPTLPLARIRELITMPEAIEAVEAAFVALDAGRAVLPGVINLDIPQYRGEVHVKSAYLSGTDYYTIKIASGFYDNDALGLPVGNGMMLVFEARTGRLAAQLLDEGWLTELRTGAAGAVCVRHCAPAGTVRVGMVGAGSQARFQLDAIRHVRTVSAVTVWSRSDAHARAYAYEMQARYNLPVQVAASVEAVARNSDVIVTVTPAHAPLVKADWLRPGQTVIAVGSDGPDKRELDAGAVGCADRVIADVLAQCARLGEIHHALDSGELLAERVVELGAVVSGCAPGRTNSHELIICDLTGVGVQDAAVAALVAKKAA
ncbi:MAG: ornithine cyclodeaminase family protein [Chloroflexi bacterium]|nr:ornithine cyclodeaminase family protein [Chloroflexota bacterium]